MSLYEQQINNLEEVILDNYVALYRHAIGDKKLFVYKHRKRKDTALLKRNQPKFCGNCGIKFYSTDSRKKWCGNYPTGEGCAYLKFREGVMKAAAKRWGGKMKFINTQKHEIN